MNSMNPSSSIGDAMDEIDGNREVEEFYLNNFPSNSTKDLKLKTFKMTTAWLTILWLYFEVRKHRKIFQRLALQIIPQTVLSLQSFLTARPSVQKRNLLGMFGGYWLIDYADGKHFRQSWNSVLLIKLLVKILSSTKCSFRRKKWWHRISHFGTMAERATRRYRRVLTAYQTDGKRELEVNVSALI